MKLITQDPQPHYTGYRPGIDYDLQLERSVLGIITIEPTAFGAVYGLLDKECFYDPAMQQVYLVAEELYEHGQPIDLLTLAHALHRKEVMQLGHTTTPAYLQWLSHHVTGSAHLEQWCLLLRQLAARRLMLRLTRGGLQDDDIFTTADSIQAAVTRALEIRTANAWDDGAAAGRKFMEHRRQVEQGGGRVGISTTLSRLDRLNGGFRPGQFIILAARPSVGKSALAGGIALHTARHEGPVGFISLEMSTQEVFARMVSADANEPYSTVDRDLLLEEHQRTRMYQSVDRVAGLPIYFSDEAQVSIHDIRARAEKLKRRHGICLLIVDYLQLIEETNTRAQRNREQQISEISRGLKKLAMNLHIPVIALSQLNRESENRHNKRPLLSDLRESGSLEQDADIVLLLHRDWRCGITTDDMGQSTEFQAQLLIPKWRNGATMDIPLSFDPEVMRFGER